MPTTNATRFYPLSEFTSLVGPLERALFLTHLSDLTLDVPIVGVAVGNNAVRIDWSEFPSTSDLAAIASKVASFTGGSTTGQPFEFNSFDVATNATATPAQKIVATTPPLEAGTYQVIWTSSLRMQAVIAGTGVEGKIRLERSDGALVEQTDAWDLNVRHAFNGAITFVVQEGQTLDVELSFLRLGASGTAEMSGARVSIDKLS